MMNAELFVYKFYRLKIMKFIIQQEIFLDYIMEIEEKQETL